MTKKNSLLIVLMLVAAFALVACDAILPGTEPEAAEGEAEGVIEAPAATDSVEKTIYVGPQLVDCEGEGPQQCMLIKEDPNGEYLLHYFPIEGFNYEPGYEYELVIREEAEANPPAGGSSIRWTLVEEVSKTPAESVPEEVGQAGGRIITGFVGPQLVDCDAGAGPRKCMMVKTNPDDEYSLFYDNIEGFVYEEGFEYELSVLVEPVQNPPADASALRYTLLEEISRTPALVETPATGESTGAQTPVLEGVTWRLSNYVNLQGEAAALLTDTRITLSFEENQVAGSAGCNNYFGPYQVDGDSLTVGPLGSTMKACFPEEVMLQETAYLANLGKVAHYEFVDGKLQLSDESWKTLLIYDAEKATSLTGTVWNVVGFNNGREAVVSVILDTAMTAIFTDEGTVGGSAGCNNYRAGYEAGDGTITIDPAAVTRKLCAEPEGIMEQESQYLAALLTAAAYEIDGDRLDLYTAEGSRAANFIAAGSSEEAESETVAMPVIAAGSDDAAAGGVEKTIYVGPETADCVGVAPQQCLLVKDEPDGEYQFYYSSIEGFDYEPGFEYELRILEETVANPPADSSSLRWILLEVVNKTPVDAVDSEANTAVAASLDLAGTSWQWLGMTTPVEIVTVPDPSSYTVDFVVDGTVGVQADCNSGSGTYEADDGSLSINITSTTLALCAEESLSDLFIRSLNAVAIYFEQDGNLFIDLFADGGTMEFAPNQ